MNATLKTGKQDFNPDGTSARVIPIRFFLKEKMKSTKTPTKKILKEDPNLFYTKPIFKAKKYELF